MDALSRSRSQWPHGQRHEQSSFARPLVSNPARGMDVCMRLFCVSVVPCVDSGLTTGCCPVQGVLLTVYRTKKLKQRPRSNKRTVQPKAEIVPRTLLLFCNILQLRLTTTSRLAIHNFILQLPLYRLYIVAGVSCSLVWPCHAHFRSRTSVEIWLRQVSFSIVITTIKWEDSLRGFSPQANYTDRATAACRRSQCPF
jgi:hypothetical protein